MAAFLVVIVLVCGYIYIGSHVPSKILFNSSGGWLPYLQAARRGIYHMLYAMVIMAILWGISWLVMLLLNIMHHLSPVFPKFTFASELPDIHIAGIGLPFIALVMLLVSFIDKVRAEKQINTDQGRQALYDQVAKISPVDSILLESIRSEEQLLVFVTLKSRKVYIGIVHDVGIDEHDMDNIALIPFLSGYRHKDTLTFIEEVNYVDHYKQNEITYTSVPLSLAQYRHVIPREQVETVSLFHSETYSKFRHPAPPTE